MSEPIKQPAGQKCGRGTYWNEEFGACMAVRDARDCPLGYYWDEVNKTCVKYQQAPKPGDACPIDPADPWNSLKPNPRLHGAPEPSKNGTVMARFNGAKWICPINWTRHSNAPVLEDESASGGDAWCTANPCLDGPQPPNPPNPPDPPTPGDDDECCSEATLCDGLTSILDELVKTQKEIAEAIAGGFGDCDKIFTKCQDELDEIIQRKVDDELKKFASCQTQAAAGLCGTAEYAEQCGKYALKCAGDECYEVGIGNKKGSCKGCGKEPCCCKDGKCEPCPEEPAKKKKYYGWCDSITKLVYVTFDEEEAPTQTARSVAFADTEEVAFDLAMQYCHGGGETEPTNGETPDIPASTSTIGCDLFGYNTDANIIRLKQYRGDEEYALGIARAYSAVADVGLAGLTIDDIGQLFQGLMQAYVGIPAKMLPAWAKATAHLVGCDSAEMQSAITSYASFGIMEKMIGADMSFLTTPYRYAMSAKCRNKFLDPDKAMAAYLANGLTRAQLETQWAIHGFCPEAISSYEKAAVAKPIPLELATMQLRGIIPESDYYIGMRRLGYTNQKDSRNLLKLRQQIPTMSDIIRFMVRDADDEDLVTQFKLDFGFPQKYRKQLKEWSEQQGVPEIMAKYAWRAHWDIPSPTQLFQFWRRLRKNPAFGGEAVLWKNIGDALTQQDILPFWHEHYKAVSYTLLGRVDIRRMLNIGSLAEADLEPAYQQLGYSDADAKRLKKFAIVDRDRSIGRHPIVKLWTDTLISRGDAVNRLTNLGFPQAAVNSALDDAAYQFDDSLAAGAFTRGLLTRQQFEQELANYGVQPGAVANIVGKLAYKVQPVTTLRQYNAGVIDRNAAANEMNRKGMHPQAVVNLLDDADKEQKVAEVLACQQAVRRRFITGDLDKLGAQNALTASGTEVGRAATLVNGWACQLVARGKDAAIPKLCEWLARGAIGPQDFLARLKRLGWDDPDAAMIMQDCLISIDLKREREAAKRVKDDEARRKQEQRALEQSAAKAQRALAQLEAGRRKAQTTTDRRQRQLLSATEKIIKKCDCTLAEATDFAKGANRSLQTEWGLSKDDALAVLISAVDSWFGDNFEGLTNNINLAASLLQEADADIAEPTI